MDYVAERVIHHADHIAYQAVITVAVIIGIDYIIAIAVTAYKNTI